MQRLRQRSFPSLLGLLAIAFSLAHTTQVVAADDDSKAQRQSNQKFNFRIDSLSEEQIPNTAPVWLIGPEPVGRSSATPYQTDTPTVCLLNAFPQMPRKAQQGGIQGTVIAQLRIKDDAVYEVVILSGPPVFHDSVIKAIKQYKCISFGEVIASQAFIFVLE